MRRPSLLLSFVLCAGAAGCSSTEPYEKREKELLWKLDAAEQAAEQSEVDKRLAQKEVELAQSKVHVLNERLALAYDAVREARAKLDAGLHDRLQQLSESSTTGQKYEISQYGGIVLESGIFFASGSHELTSKGQEALRSLVATLSKDEYKEYEIELAGHTDADKITRTAARYRDNHDLAAMRANSVRRFLIEQGGVGGERVYLSAWGPDKPLGGEKAGKTGKAADRRVEILLHKKTDATSLPASSPRAGGADADAAAKVAEDAGGS